MKKLLLASLLFLFIAPLAKSQDFIVLPQDTVRGQVSENGFLKLLMYFQNTSGSAYTTEWEVTNSSVNANWDISLCDNINCWFSVPTGMKTSSSVNVGDSMFFKFEVEPYTYMGNGFLDIDIWTTGNSENKTSVRFEVSAVPIGILDPEVERPLEIYSVPGQESVSIVVPKELRGALDLKVMDLKGTLIETRTVQAAERLSLDMGHLHNGIYLMQLGNGEHTWNGKFVMMK